jgi:flagellar basal-body rod modification protein FlgD
MKYSRAKIKGGGPMNVIPVAASIIGRTPAATGTTAGSNGSKTSNPIQDTNSMFMKLLVAQLQNQSPLSPVDPSQFTSQLVQFNMLDQLSQINQTLQNGLGSASGAGAKPSGGANNSVQGAQ